ncbi:Pkinase domain-containing protein/B_lectin domain-containing protein [Cephalotus follicularis]|uniref:Receptor-like serine/threonine-protein kinase n=1 Tax=Cephalotus follicularis TaxID=3775 RepID=A0A1Q3CL22_CEPFO|nr:Pkinase domain-containing protein/B_lectin domain-containing protein [Cephalotus follicularis]
MRFAGVVMTTWGVTHPVGFILLAVLLVLDTCRASIRSIGMIHPGYQGSEMSFIDNNGLFLLSNNSTFGFGFNPTTNDVTLFLLVVIHMRSLQVIWSANRGSPVAISDNFVFDKNGNVFLQKGGSVVWSLNTSNQGVSAMELQESGNLVLLGNGSKVIWQSFSHPTNTLISNQDFIEGMKLVSDPSSDNLTYILEIKSGDMFLSAGYPTPQPYWSMGKETLKIVSQHGGKVILASLVANSWEFYDQSKALLWQFIFSSTTDVNVTWTAVLGNDGIIYFYNLDDGSPPSASSTKIPNDQCSTPESCDPYYVCSGDNQCQCPSALNTLKNCQTRIKSPCDQSKGSMDLVDAGDTLSYVALGYLSPSSKTDLNGCKSSCLMNCSCRVLFFQNSSGSCFLLDNLGSFQNSGPSSNLMTYIKIVSVGTKSGGVGSSQKRFPYVVIIAIATVLIIFGILFVAFRFYRKKNKLPESLQESSEEDNFLESLSGMPIRFSYKDLQTATNNFSVKLGQGGFGSVYQGALPDGTRLAVKQLEGIGQGKKEFRAEVSIIGSIHHHHLVNLKGFCAEGSHRLLAYEFMANGSLDKWIFRKNKEEFLLDWETRFNIALGTAKGLAYLHEDCDSKIVHCDIKPENVLLDDTFLAKVSDFGLAKLMTREQSIVFTTLRGTRGYLAPEWITNYAISEKSDVYSYGMVLLEIIGGRKNFDPEEISDKSHFPSYAFKMLEEGKLKDILDSKMCIDGKDEVVLTAIKVALWCIQEDMSMRPSMTKVVQMLEGISPVLDPPTSTTLGSRLYSSFFKSISEEGTSSGPSDCNSDAYLSAVRLSGPR